MKRVLESVAVIEGLSHEGRGVARVEGKVVFVFGALPGERVRFRYVKRRGRFDEGEAIEVLEPSPARVAPRCPHFGTCGGCILQHLRPDLQVRFKEAALAEQLQAAGHVEPETWFPPLTGPSWGYRRRARLGVKHVPKKGGVLVGFRERKKPYIADIRTCPVLHPSVGGRIERLRALVQGLEARSHIPQIEVAVGDDGKALVFRHLIPLSQGDREQLAAFGREEGFAIHLQPGGMESVHPLWGEERLSYMLGDLKLSFRPTDFIQVNAEVNRKMAERAVELLEPGPGDKVLDLFCGIGNFTLPLARHAGEVIGVEGEKAQVQEARRNARENAIENARFLTADLTAPLGEWAKGCTKALLDPPRSGALEAVKQLAALEVGRILYVSCNPATLARDACLLKEAGYRLTKAGVMDMFPHTAHVEAMALFSAGG